MEDGEAPKAGKSPIDFPESDSDFVTDAPAPPERLRDVGGVVCDASFAEDLRRADGVGSLLKRVVKLETKL
jgi:hypothetical protein